MKKTFLAFLLVAFWVASLPVLAAPSGDYAVFAQVDNNRKTLYYAKADGSDLQTIISGENIVFFPEGKHLLYFTDHQLYEYTPVSRESKLLSKFDEDWIAIQKLSDEPDQAIIVAGNGYEYHWYIIDFPDGGSRRIEEPMGIGTAQNTLKGVSPDGLATAIIKTAAMELRFQLIIQEKVNGKLKTVWSSPKKMSVIPDLPVWAPNSRLVAFFGKDDSGIEGFYSLYLLDLSTKKMVQVQKQVFSKLFFNNNVHMGTFTPNWSHDSKHLIFQYRPYGLPTESSIMKYEVSTGISLSLTNSSGNNENPVWSPSGNSILFLSDRDGSNSQLYVMDEQGEHVSRLSPAEGKTQWAKWWE